MAADALTEAHIEAQTRLRDIVQGLIGQLWLSLGSWRDADVGRFVSQATQLVFAGQMQAAALTAAYLAEALRIASFGIDPTKISGAIVRNGTPPEDVYRRPFVNVWKSLSDGQPLDVAVASGRARAESAANIDVAMASRAAFAVSQDQIEGIYGYQRVARPGACDFCQAVNGAYVKSAYASPLHNHCGCSLQPLTRPHPKAAYLPSGAHVSEAYAVHEHGELGAVLTDPSDHFTTEHQIEIGAGSYGGQ